jgi:rhodanese-related sulfurtransferase
VAYAGNSKSSTPCFSLARRNRSADYVRSVRRIRSIAPERAWEQFGRGEAQLFDLRTELERRRYGWPLGARRVSLTRHIAWPDGTNTIYLCQHANRSKLTAWRGAAEVAGGWPAWQAASLPIERPAAR